MNKNGAYTMQIGTTANPWWVVPGWVADSAYPGSTVVGEGLRVSADKVAATITANLVFSGGTSTGGSLVQKIRLLVDGVSVVEGPTVTGTSGVLLATVTGDVVEGSVITVETATNAGLSGWAPSINASGSYVRIT
ncbi:hypothetical protein [Nocardia higoensis]|uniref:hypothetical protein n=1 Tax=Nocardia higoensis TaxID=228599 RepID=UPI00059355A2|nr:hypothetical protein [Nocardia higoensis]